MNITRLNTLNDDKVIIKKEGGGNGGGNTIEYRDVRGLDSVTRANWLDYFALMVRLEHDVAIMTLASKQAGDLTNLLGGADVVAAISTDLNAKFVASSSEGVLVMTAKEVLIEHGWWEEYNSCPIITEEEFYSIEKLP